MLKNGSQIKKDLLGVVGSGRRLTLSDFRKELPYSEYSIRLALGTLLQDGILHCKKNGCYKPRYFYKKEGCWK